jgi:hypothetical protein
MTGRPHPARDRHRASDGICTHDEHEHVDVAKLKVRDRAERQRIAPADLRLSGISTQSDRPP